MKQSWWLLIPVQIEGRVVVLSLVVFILVSHVFPDHLFVDANGGDEVSSAPKVLLLRWCFPLGEFKVCPDGAFAFEEAHDIGNAFSGRDGEDEMNVIGHRVAFENGDVSFFGEFADDLANSLTGKTVELFLPVLWYNDHVVLAVPYHVTL